MAVLFDIDHEAGDLSEYDSTVTDGGDLSAEVGAALASTSYGLQCVIDDTTAIYGEGNLGTSSITEVTRARFYIDPNSLSIDNYQPVVVCNLFSSNTDPVILAQIEGEASGYTLRIGTWEDDATWHSTTTAMTDAEHYIEIEINRAATAVSSDGTVEAWLDGVALTSITGLDNFNRYDDFDYVRLGAMDVHSSASGTIYLDQLVVNDDGSEIGAHSAAGLSIPVAMHHYMHKVFG